MPKWLKDWLTELDGSACPVRATGLIAAIIMMVKFVLVASPDFQSFGLGIAAVIAAISAKAYLETKGDTNA